MLGDGLGAGLLEAKGRDHWEVKVERLLSFVLSRRVASDQTAACLPSSPDPFKTPSRTSPLLPLPPYPPPEHSSRAGSGKTPPGRVLFLCFAVGAKGRSTSVRSVGRGTGLFPGVDAKASKQTGCKLAAELGRRPGASSLAPCISV